MTAKYHESKYQGSERQKKHDRRLKRRATTCARTRARDEKNSDASFGMPTALEQQQTRQGPTRTASQLTDSEWDEHLPRALISVIGSGENWRFLEPYRLPRMPKRMAMKGMK